MHPFKPPLLGFLAALALLSPARAAMHDMGPMAITAEGAPTPDAGVLSKMHLPDPSPNGLSGSSAVDIKRSAARRSRGHTRWLQIQGLSSRISGMQRSGKLTTEKASALGRELLAIEDKYHLRNEADALDLPLGQGKLLRTELNALERQLERDTTALKR